MWHTVRIKDETGVVGRGFYAEVSESVEAVDVGCMFWWPYDSCTRTIKLGYTVRAVVVNYDYFVFGLNLEGKFLMRFG